MNIIHFLKYSCIRILSVTFSFCLKYSYIRTCFILNFSSPRKAFLLAVARSSYFTEAVKDYSRVKMTQNRPKYFRYLWKWIQVERKIYSVKRKEICRLIYSAVKQIGDIFPLSSTSPSKPTDPFLFSPVCFEARFPTSLVNLVMRSALLAQVVSAEVFRRR